MSRLSQFVGQELNRKMPCNWLLDCLTSLMKDNLVSLIVLADLRDAFGRFGFFFFF